MQKNECQEWFAKADQDGMSMTALVLNKQGPPNTVCFLAQQMVEKYLKGLYIGTRYPGDYPDFDWKVAQSAFDKAEKNKKFVLTKII